MQDCRNLRVWKLEHSMTIQMYQSMHSMIVSIKRMLATLLGTLRDEGSAASPAESRQPTADSRHDGVVQ